MSELKLSVIIPTMNRNDLANACIEALFSSEVIGMEVIVVNDSKTNVFELSKTAYKNKVQIVNNPKSGVASARNHGVSVSKGEILLFMDDDMIANAEAITNAIEKVSSENCTYNSNWSYSAAALKQISQNPFGRFLIKTGYTNLKGWCTGMLWQENTLLNSEGITSQFLAIRRTTFQKAGGYTEGYPYAGFEDYDLSKKLKAQAVTTYIDTRVCITHNELDRLNLGSWLERKKRGAVSRKYAVKKGHQELTLFYSFKKRFVLNSLRMVKPLVLFVLEKFPNSKTIEPLHDRLLHSMIALYIFDGYQTE